MLGVEIIYFPYTDSTSSTKLRAALELAARRRDMRLSTLDRLAAGACVCSVR